MSVRRRTLVKWLAALPLVGGAASLVALGAARASNPYYQGPVSDHFDGVNFFNPGGNPPKGFLDLLKWQTSGKRRDWPERWPSPHADKPPPRVAGSGLRVSFVGHATVLIQTGGLNILTDPVWSERCSPVSFAGPKRVNDPGIALSDLPDIDVVLLSHNHYDHLDLDTLSFLRASHDPLIVTPLGNDTILKAHDGAFRVAVGDWGDTLDIGPDMKVHLEPAHHWSARGMGDRRNALWAAFVIEGAGGRIYHVGDTGWHDGINYRAAREKYGSFRLAILPFGAYEPRDFMRFQHQNPDEAVRGHLECNAAYTLGHHWGTFQLTDEHIDEQIADLDAALARHDVGPDTFRRLLPGEAWDVPQTSA